MLKVSELSVIILNYNTKDILKRCLLSVTKAIGSRDDIEITVVDNCSNDKSAEMIRKDFPKVNLIINKKNLGYAAGNNIALRKCQSRFVLLLNPDTEIFPDTLKIMLEYMNRNTQVGAATCMVKLKNGQIDDACHRGFPTPWNALCYFSGLGKIFPQSVIFDGYHLGYRELNKIHEIDACCGAFMMIRQELGQKLNWLDEDYFFYGEDLDFCYRAKQNGWKIIFNPETSILHWKGVSSGMKEASSSVATANKETKKRAIMGSIQAMKIFYQKHYLKKYPSILTKIVLFGISLLEQNRLKTFKE